MRTSLLIALLAATAAVPAALSAQEYQRHDGGRGEGRGQQQGQPQGQRPPAAQPVQAQPPQAQPNQGQPNRGQFNGQRGGGFDRGAVPQVQQPQGQPQFQQRPQYNRGPAAQGYRDGGAYTPRADNQDRGDRQQGQRPGFGANGNGGQRDWRGTPDGVNRDGRDQRDFQGRGNGRPDGRFDGRGGYDGGRGGDRQGFQQYQRNGADWRDNNRAQRGFEDRRDWNRGWRQDGRYNYSALRARNRDAFHLPRYYAPGGWNYGYRRFSVGFRLSSELFAQNYWIDDVDYYGLPPAYGPYRWVRYYNDALLVDTYTGEVVDTVYDIFW